MTSGLAGLKAILCLILAGPILFGREIRVRLSLGQASAKAYSYSVQIQPGSADSTVYDFRGIDLEPDDSANSGLWTGRAGGGDTDTICFTLAYQDDQGKRTAHVMWSDLIAHSDADTAKRLLRDPAFSLRPGLATIWFDKGQTRGFTFSADAILSEGTIWIPSFDAFLTLEDHPVSFVSYQHAAAVWRGNRILERTAREAEASYKMFASLWEDMGNPSYMHPHQVPPGHIACLSWDGALAKFGIDRGGGVWNDYGNPDHFRFWFGFGDLTQGITRTWKAQTLQSGLPVITTVFEDGPVRYELEQFA